MNWSSTISEVFNHGVRKQVMAGNGIDLIRTWGFLNGVNDPSYAAVSIQPSVNPPPLLVAHVFIPSLLSKQFMGLHEATRCPFVARRSSGQILKKWQ